MLKLQTLVLYAKATNISISTLKLVVLVLVLAMQPTGAIENDVEASLKVSKVVSESVQVEPVLYVAPVHLA